MAGQRNQDVFVFFVIMVLFAVSFVFSFPRENSYGLIPRRGMLSVYELKSRLSLIVRVNVVLNRTVVVDSD